MLHVLLMILITLNNSMTIFAQTTSPIIDQHTLLQYTPQAPEEVLQQAQQWLSDNQDFVDTALGYEPLIGPMKSFHDQTIHDPVDDVFLNKNIQRLSTNNYVFKLPTNDNYLIKVSNRFNRKENIYTLYNYVVHPQSPFDRAHYTYGTFLTQEHYQVLQKFLTDEEYDAQIIGNTTTRIKTAPKTYQTISRMAHWLLLQKTVREHNLAHLIATSAMYVIHIPWRPTEISDRNYIVIEEEVKNLQKIEQLSTEEENAVLLIIQEVGLFNCTKDNILRTQDGKIIFIDLEQPNNANPRHFFHKAHDRFINNANAGLSSFKEDFATKN